MTSSHFNFGEVAGLAHDDFHIGVFGEHFLEAFFAVVSGSAAGGALQFGDLGFAISVLGHPPRCSLAAFFDKIAHRIEGGVEGIVHGGAAVFDDYGNAGVFHILQSSVLCQPVSMTGASDDEVHFLGDE